MATGLLQVTLSKAQYELEKNHCIKGPMPEQMSYLTEWFKEDLPPLDDDDNREFDKFLKSFQGIGFSPRDPLQAVKPLIDWETFDTPQGAPKKRKVLIFSDGCGLCEGLMEFVPEEFVAKTQIVDTPIGELADDGMSSLLRPGWDLVIFASGLDEPGSNSVDDILQVQGAVMKAFLSLVQSIQKLDTGTIKSLAVITADTHAEDAELHAEVGAKILTNAGLFGMSNTARMELNIPLQYIDTEYYLSAKTLQSIARELFIGEGFGQDSVRILEKGRYVLRHIMTTAYEVRNREFEVPTNGVILISGGNGALGLLMGQWLLKKLVAKKVQSAPGLSIKFLSRSLKVSEPAIWRDVEKLAAKLGVSVEQAKCDVSSRGAVEEYVKACSPDIVGVIHSAGVLRDSLLVNQDWEKFETVFSAKSHAALYLHDALERMQNPKLSFFWMFSSVAVYGSPGQAPYSASNSILDSLARHRVAMGKPAMAVQWAGWGEIGMAKNLDEANRRRMENSPMPAFANAEGFKGLEHGIKTGVPYFSVCKYNRDVIIGMTEKCQSVTQSYARNFLSKLVPLGGYTKPYLYQRLHHMMTAQEKPHDHGWLQWDAYVYDAGHVQ